MRHLPLLLLLPASAFAAEHAGSGAAAPAAVHAAAIAGVPAISAALSAPAAPANMDAPVIFIVEPDRAAGQRGQYLNNEDQAALKAAVAGSNGLARPLEGDGSMEIFAQQAYLE